MQDGDRKGPFKVFQLLEMVRAEEVRDTDMAWCQAVDRWMPLKEMPPLEGILTEPDEDEDASEEVVAKVRETDAKERAERSQPWMRFLARTIDTWIIFQVATVIAVVTGIFTADALFPTSFDNPGDIFAKITLAVISSYVWVFIEAWSISKWATTPGKALFKIRITHEDGRLLSYGESMRRAVSVWIRGFALGIEPVQFITFLASFFFLKQDGQTPWDAKQSLKLSHQPLTQNRWIMIFLVAFSMFLIKGSIPLALDSERRDQLRQEIEKKTQPKPEVPARDPSIVQVNTVDSWKVG